MQARQFNTAAFLFILKEFIMCILTSFERNIIKKFLCGKIPELVILDEQISKIKYVERDYTGYGFFIKFCIEKEKCNPIKQRNVILSDVVGEIKGIKHGVGFILYIKNGYLNELECYTYDEKLPDCINDYVLFFDTPNHKRNEENLNKKFLYTEK